MQRPTFDTVINATGGWTSYGAGVLSDEARAAFDAISRVSVVMTELRDEADRTLASALGVEAACVVNCAAAALAVTAAAMMAHATGVDPRQLPDRPPRKRRVLLPKGHALNFSAEITQMLRMAGAEPVEMGAVNACPAELVAQACKDEDVVAALYVQASDVYGFGSVSLEDYVGVCHAAGVPVIVDVAGQPLMQPLVASGADLFIASPHKFMGSPTAGVIFGRRALVEACVKLEGSFARPFKISKEALAGVMAAVPRWSRCGESVVNEVWEERARHAESRFAGIKGVTFRRFYFAAPLQGVHAHLAVDATLFGMDAGELAQRLKYGRPRVAVVEEQAANGILSMHFGMLDEQAIDVFADALRVIAENQSADNCMTA